VIGILSYSYLMIAVHRNGSIAYENHLEIMTARSSSEIGLLIIYGVFLLIDAKLGEISLGLFVV
jgi:hypothetical protein